MAVGTVGGSKCNLIQMSNVDVNGNAFLRNNNLDFKGSICSSPRYSSLMYLRRRTNELDVLHIIFTFAYYFGWVRPVSEESYRTPPKCNEESVR